MNRMKIPRLLAVTLASLGLFAGCGGGSDGDATPAAPTVVPTTTDVSTTVADGAIKGATVCLDKNGNGNCDADETKGTTDGNGKVTLAVPNADVGKYPILAIIGTDAVDAVNGAVTTAYTMTAPADQVAVVTPLTTLVQQTVATTGASTADAVKSVQSSTGITASLFLDLSKASTAPTDGSVDPVAVARLLVVTTQKQTAAVAAALGTMAADNTAITQSDLDKAVQKKLLELLPALVAALSDPSVASATTPAAKEAALLSAANTLVSTSGLTAAAAATVVAINTQTSTTAPVSARVASAFATLDALSFSNTGNFFVRELVGSLAQDTPDSNGIVKYTERRQRSNNGALARWSSGGDPARTSDLSWNGSAWAACPINFENTATVRDAAGNNSYTYCGRETGKSNRATFDIAGKTLASAYAQVIAAGYTNLFIADPATALDTAIFPADSKIVYQAITPLTTAISYYPAGANSPAGTSNIVSQYSAAVAAGGVASTQAANTACNSSESNTFGVSATSLESMIAVKGGTPCIYAAGTLTYNGITYSSDAGVDNAWWGNSTVSLGNIGSVSTSPISTSTGYYTGNMLLRAAFKGAGANAVTYYACKQRYLTGSTRNCAVAGTGTYTITTLGDARALVFNNLPAPAAVLTYERVLVERGGFVYFGYKNKTTVSNRARLNTIAGNALLTKLGITIEDPAMPLALTAASYQGTWDFRGTATLPGGGTTVFVNGNGTSSCQDRSNSLFFACTVNITNPATGALTFTDATGTASGNFDFMAGTASGIYHDTTSVPIDGTFTAGRR